MVRRRNAADFRGWLLWAFLLLGVVLSKSLTMQSVITGSRPYACGVLTGVVDCSDEDMDSRKKSGKIDEIKAKGRQLTGASVSDASEGTLASPAFSSPTSMIQERDTLTTRELHPTRAIAWTAAGFPKAENTADRGAYASNALLPSESTTTAVSGAATPAQAEGRRAVGVASLGSASNSAETVIASSERVIAPEEPEATLMGIMVGNGFLKAENASDTRASAKGRLKADAEWSGNTAAEVATESSGGPASSGALFSRTARVPMAMSHDKSGAGREVMSAMPSDAFTIPTASVANDMPTPTWEGSTTTDVAADSAVENEVVRTPTQAFGPVRSHRGVVDEVTHDELESSAETSSVTTPSTDNIERRRTATTASHESSVDYDAQTLEVVTAITRAAETSAIATSGGGRRSATAVGSAGGAVVSTRTSSGEMSSTSGVELITTTRLADVVHTPVSSTTTAIAKEILLEGLTPLYEDETEETLLPTADGNQMSVPLSTVTTVPSLEEGPLGKVSFILFVDKEPLSTRRLLQPFSFLGDPVISDYKENLALAAGVPVRCVSVLGVEEGAGTFAIRTSVKFMSRRSSPQQVTAFTDLLTSSPESVSAFLLDGAVRVTQMTVTLYSDEDIPGVTDYLYGLYGLELNFAGSLPSTPLATTPPAARHDKSSTAVIIEDFYGLYGLEMEDGALVNLPAETPLPTQPDDIAADGAARHEVVLALGDDLYGLYGLGVEEDALADTLAISTPLPTQPDASARNDVVLGLRGDFYGLYGLYFAGDGILSSVPAPTSIQKKPEDASESDVSAMSRDLYGVYGLVDVVGLQPDVATTPSPTIDPPLTPQPSSVIEDEDLLAVVFYGLYGVGIGGLQPSDSSLSDSPSPTTTPMPTPTPPMTTPSPTPTLTPAPTTTQSPMPTFSPLSYIAEVRFLGVVDASTSFGRMDGDTLAIAYKTDLATPAGVTVDNVHLLSVAHSVETDKLDTMVKFPAIGSQSLEQVRSFVNKLVVSPEKVWVSFPFDSVYVVADSVVLTVYAEEGIISLAEFYGLYGLKFEGLPELHPFPEPVPTPTVPPTPQPTTPSPAAPTPVPSSQLLAEISFTGVVAESILIKGHDNTISTAFLITYRSDLAVAAEVSIDEVIIPRVGEAGDGKNGAAIATLLRIPDQRGNTVDTVKAFVNTLLSEPDKVWSSFSANAIVAEDVLLTFYSEGRVTLDDFYGLYGLKLYDAPQPPTPADPTTPLPTNTPTPPPTTTPGPITTPIPSTSPPPSLCTADISTCMEEDLVKAGGQPALSVNVREITEQRRRRLSTTTSSDSSLLTPPPACSTVLVAKISYIETTTHPWIQTDFFVELVYPPDADQELIKELVSKLETDPTNAVFHSFDPKSALFELYWGPFTSRIPYSSTKACDVDSSSSEGSDTITSDMTVSSEDSSSSHRRRRSPHRDDSSSAYSPNYDSYGSSAKAEDKNSFREERKVQAGKSKTRKSTNKENTGDDDVIDDGDVVGTSSEDVLTTDDDLATQIEASTFEVRGVDVPGTETLAELFAAPTAGPELPIEGGAASNGSVTEHQTPTPDKWSQQNDAGDINATLSSVYVADNEEPLTGEADYESYGAGDETRVSLADIPEIDDETGDGNSTGRRQPIADESTSQRNTSRVLDGTTEASGLTNSSSYAGSLESFVPKLMHDSSSSPPNASDHPLTEAAVDGSFTSLMSEVNTSQNGSRVATVSTTVPEHVDNAVDSFENDDLVDLIMPLVSHSGQQEQQTRSTPSPAGSRDNGKNSGNFVSQQDKALPLFMLREEEGPLAAFAPSAEAIVDSGAKLSESNKFHVGNSGLSTWLTTLIACISVGVITTLIAVGAYWNYIRRRRSREESRTVIETEELDLDDGISATTSTIDYGSANGSLSLSSDTSDCDSVFQGACCESPAGNSSYDGGVGSWVDGHSAAGAHDGRICEAEGVKLAFDGLRSGVLNTLG